MISDHPAWRYRRAGLGHLVREPLMAPWTPLPALVPYEDPYLMARVIRGLRRL